MCTPWHAESAKRPCALPAGSARVRVPAFGELGEELLPFVEPDGVRGASAGRGSGSEVDQVPGSTDHGEVMTAGYVEEFVEGLGVTAAAGGDQDALRGGQKFAAIRAPSGNQAGRGRNRGEG